MKGLNGKTALVTVASSGIGQGQTLFIDGGLTLYADFREA